MIERLFQWSGYASSALMAFGLATLGAWPGAAWSAWPVYVGLLMLILTPVSRVIAATVRYVHEGDRMSAALTASILVVIALSAWVAAGN